MKISSAKLNVQLLAETLIQSGVEDIIISPGSRNGGLTMQFVNDDRFNCYSVVDERCAAFVALGIAQVIHKPVVICCTSGSAAANYYPAVTEAFYQNIPLIVLTADRPANLTDQFDGQTIRQQGLYELHTYFQTQLSESETESSLKDNFNRIKEAIQTSLIKSGPVHINMPFSEPLYEHVNEKKIVIDHLTKPSVEQNRIQWDELLPEYYQTNKIMILVGMQHSIELNSLLKKLDAYPNIIILTETTSNLHHANFISKIDATLRNITESELDEFKPDLLITLGQNVISKRIKKFLRSNAPSFHWHIDEHWHPDTYFSLTQKVISSAERFTKEFLFEIDPTDSSYQKLWLDKKEIQEVSQKDYLRNITWSDLWVFQQLIASYAKDYTIHYSNSSVIRYAQLFDHDNSNMIFCNRGTSGIDGSTSTAIGHAIKSNKPVILVTGDISFFYDSNALWNKYIPSDFRIVLINNGGGSIFRIIPGPSNTNALEKFFETQHNLTAEHLAKMYVFEYIVVDTKEELMASLNDFYLSSERPKILEINTAHAKNAEILTGFIQVNQN